MCATGSNYLQNAKKHIIHSSDFLRPAAGATQAENLLANGGFFIVVPPEI
jgi:hypothetical protein